LYIQGVTVDWSGFNQDYSHEKVELPTYPFQRQRYWIETEKNYFQKKQPLFRGKILHRLLGEKLYLAGLEKQHRFESQISASEPAYLSHHRIFEQAILPATAYLEIALAAGLNRWKSPKLLVEDVVLQRGLILPEDELKTVQTILTPLENEAYQFQIFSQEQKDNQDEPTWILHGSGKISSAKTDTIPLSIDLEKYLTECEQSIEITAYYQKYKQRGMDYGASFQGIQQLWKGSKQAVGKIKLSPELVEQATDYQLHPALLDAAFQVIGAAMEEIDSDQIYLPVGMKKMRVYCNPKKEVWAIISIKGQALESDITLVDEQGILVAQIEGLKLMVTKAQAFLHSLLEIFGSSESLNRADFLEELQQVPISDRQSMLLSYLRKQVANVLGLRDSQIDVEQSLTELGLDSLMGVEIRNKIISQLKIEVPVANFIEGYNIDKLSKLLLEELVLKDLMDSDWKNVEDHIKDDMEEIIL
jgi:acyl transferase domain-containing protein